MPPVRFRRPLVVRAVTLAFLTPVASSAAYADPGKGNGHGPPITPPGQAKAPGQPAQPAHAQEAAPAAQAPRGDARAHHKSRPAPSRARQPRSGRPSGASRPHAPAARREPKPAAQRGGGRAAKGSAGRTTVCHATGSSTNPYVTITVSDNALGAHRRHQDGRDIIPAPAGGCPEKSRGSGGKGKKKIEHGGKPKHRKRQQKVTICHATGSATNPFVRITIAVAAVEAHRRHQDGRDIIPAPEGGCPGAPGAHRVASGLGGPLGGPPTPSASAAAPVAAQLGAVAAAPALAPAAVSGPGAAPAAAAAPVTPAAAPFAGQVLGAVDELPAEAAPAEDVAAPLTATRESGGGLELPFTGLDLWVLAMAGGAALLAGIAGRRAHGLRRS